MSEDGWMVGMNYDFDGIVADGGPTGIARGAYPIDIHNLKDTGLTFMGAPDDDGHEQGASRRHSGGNGVGTMLSTP